MYRVLIVDDEPIVLSGIKFMIDWKKENMELCGTARNGRQALEMIEERRPDLVICDINMPVMTGLELLKILDARPIAPVMVMLTNLEEFETAQQSLHYRAVEYLLKSELEPEVLHGALARAAEEAERRRTLLDATALQGSIRENTSRILSNCMGKLWGAPLEGPEAARQKEILTKQGVLASSCLFIEILLDYSPLPELENYTREELRRVFESLHEILETLRPKAFRNSVLFYPGAHANAFVLFCWEVGADAPALAAQLYTKFCASGAALTPTKISFLVGDTFCGPSELAGALQQMERLRDRYYLDAQSYLTGREPGTPAAVPLRTVELCNRLVLELRSKNRAGCTQLLDKARRQLATQPHTRQEGARCCTELFSTASSVLIPMVEPGRLNLFFSNLSEGLSQINGLVNRAQVLAWFDAFAKQLDCQLESLANARSELVDRVRRYILQNMDKRIMLQDVGRSVNMAPSYLSAAFKKQSGKNLVDFINELKMERACAIIQSGQCKIYEISYLLGYENAYYFTKVFKRHIGMTPKEYQYKVEGRTAPRAEEAGDSQK